MTLVAALTGCAGPLSAEQYAQQLFDQTNAARVKEDLEPLVWSSCASDAAMGRAIGLIGADELVHAPMGDVAATCGVSITGENLSRATAAPRAVAAAWLSSPGHAANILDEDYTDLGVACVADGEQTLCSEVFLAP